MVRKSSVLLVLLSPWAALLKSDDGTWEALPNPFSRKVTDVLLPSLDSNLFGSLMALGVLAPLLAKVTTGLRASVVLAAVTRVSGGEASVDSMSGGLALANTNC